MLDFIVASAEGEGLKTSGPVTEDVISKGFLEHLKTRKNSKKLNKASAYNKNEW